MKTNSTTTKKATGTKNQTQFPSWEHKLLTSLKPLLNYTPSIRYPYGIGDDAVLRRCTHNEQIILTTDTQIENTHFSREYMSLPTIGYRAMMVNLSDCAAMGALPDGALVSITLGKEDRNNQKLINSLYVGINRACTEFNFPIIGGDISSGPVLALCITMLGRMGKNQKPLFRVGAKNGDGLFVTGKLGSSAAGFEALSKLGSQCAKKLFPTLVQKHCKPIPRIDVGILLAQSKQIHAMIDISDGLSKETHTLAWENNCGIILDESAITLSNSMKRLALKTGHNALNWYLHGGEEYELLFAASPLFKPPTALKKLVQVTRIGTFSNTVKGVFIRQKNQNLTPLLNNSFDHLKSLGN